MEASHQRAQKKSKKDADFVAAAKVINDVYATSLYTAKTTLLYGYVCKTGSLPTPGDTCCIPPITVAGHWNDTTNANVPGRHTAVKTNKAQAWTHNGTRIQPFKVYFDVNKDRYIVGESTIVSKKSVANTKRKAKANKRAAPTKSSSAPSKKVKK